MRQYGCVSPKFWVGKTGRALRGNPDAQLVALYLMTCPTAEMYGVFYCSIASIVHEVGFDASPSEGASKGHQRVKQALSMLQKQDFLFYDFESEFVFVKEFAKWQVAERLSANDKRVISARNATESMPEPLRSMFIERYNEAFNLGLEVSPIEGALKPHRSQEQEQEQDNIYIREQETENLTHPASLVATQDACVSKKPSSKKTSVCKPDDVEQADWDEYLSIRKAKKLPLTQRGLNLLRSEAEKAGLTLQQAIVKCLEAGWAGFKAEWIKKETEEDKQSIFYVPPEQRSKKPWNGENPFAPVPDDSDYLKMNLGAFGRSTK